jgi:hypothetical protein
MIANKRLDELMSQLDEAGRELRSAGYKLSSELIAMASLQIRVERHQITDQELSAFCELIEARMSSAAATPERRRAPDSTVVTLRVPARK